MKKEEDKEKEQKEQRFTVRQTYTGDKWMCIDEKTGVFCTFETGCFMSAEYTIPEGTYDEYLVKKLMESFLYKNYYIIAYKQRFTLKQHNTKSTSKWICIDEKTGVSCKFDTGCFLTAKYTIPVWMGKASHIKKQMSEFLHKNYCSIAFKAIAESNETKEKKKEKIKEEATETKTTKRKQ
jgi:hypothetical protein